MTAYDDLETQLRNLLREYKGVSALVAIALKAPAKSPHKRYIVVSTGDPECVKLCRMLWAAVSNPSTPSPTKAEDEEDEDED